MDPKNRGAYTGRSGQMAVIAELLNRGCNAAIPEVDVGMLGLPGFAGDGFVSEIDAGLSLNRLFAIVPQLTALRRDIECVAVVPGGVAVGVHDPGIPPLASSCG